MARKFSFAQDEYYHVYNRGNGKQFIFEDDRDKKRFQELLYIANSKKSFVLRDIILGKVYEIDRGNVLVDIGAYCLMFNHFHLLLHEKSAGGISQFMQKLATAYAMYFNLRHKHTGTIFEGKFKARHADEDNYLEYLFAYIHLNPVEHIEPDWKETGLHNLKRAQRYLQNYKFSSYPDYVSKSERIEEKILDQSAFPEYFKSFTDAKDYHNIWLNFDTEARPL